MHLKIWHKMIIGISIPSLIALLGGLLTYGYINDVDNRQTYVQIADDLRERVLEVRRNEKNFFHYKNEEHLNNLQQAISVFSLSISGISPEVQKEIGDTDITFLTDLIQTYAGSTVSLFETYQQESAVIEKVRTEGRRMEVFAAGGRHAVELSTSFVLNLRRLEKNYMLFRDKQSLHELNRGLSQLTNLTPLCNECTPYIKAMRNLFTISDKENSLVNDLQETGAKLEKITGEISARERERIGSFLQLTMRLLLIGLALLCTLGPLFVYKTSAYIVAPIKRLAEITNKITEGDLSLRAPIVEQDETYSLATSFNTMLDKLQLTYRSLEQSMELLKEKQAQLVESEKRASLGLLVSGVAHELNNPLNNISLITERMMEEKDELPAQEMRDLTNILSQCERAKNIVNNLLDFARARKSTVMEKLDIIKVVRESFDLVGNQLRINNIQVKDDIPDPAVYIMGNRSKLEQIFVSIITNAIQAMKSDGTLTVRLKPEAEDNQVLIKISDTGPGISKKNIKNIFDPFFTTKPVGAGTGLGLSVCRSLVQEHNGEIEADSKLRVGTTFTIKFPLYEEQLTEQSS